MKKFIFNLIVFTSFVFAQNAPIRISAQQAYNSAWHYYYPKIIITSIVDKIKIKQVIVNKGNCRFSNNDIGYISGRFRPIRLIPRTLKYGEDLEIRLKSSCHLLRVDVKTSQGDWTIEY